MLKESLLRAATQSRDSIRYGKRCWLAVVLTAMTSFCVVPSFAQLPPAPPLGPSSYRSDKIQVGVGVLTSIVKGQVGDIVVQANTMIQQQTNKVSVEALPLQVFSPMRVATQYTNRPNQYYIKLPITIPIKVKIDFTSDRMIYIPLDVNVSCEGWETGQGKVQILAKPGPPNVEGGNIVEDVIRVRDFINNQIKNNLSVPGAIPVPLPNGACVTIGASPGKYVGDPFAYIAYDPPSRFGPIRTDLVGSNVIVTFQRLKRLRARGLGAVLYQPTETILLEAYANFATHQSAVLTMHEDDEVNLDRMVLKATGLESLVVIANIRQEPTGQPEDSAFVASSRTANYSPGTHTLQITKVFIEPPGPGHNKPLQVRVPAYELTYTVVYASGPALRSQ